MRRSLPRTLAAAVTVLVLAGCSGGDDEAATETDPEPTPTEAASTEEPEPEPEPEPVAGEATLVRHDVASELGLGLPEQAPAAEDDVNTFAAQLRELLDAHLDSARTGEDSPLVAAAADGLLDAAEVEGLVAGLADADDLAVEASYVIEVSAAAALEWATVGVTTTTASGATPGATLLFTPSDGQPVLVGVGEGDA